MTIVSPIRRVQLDILGYLALPTVTVREEALLVVIEFLSRLRGEFEIGPLDDRIDWASLLAQSAINALDHVDVVAGRASCTVAAAGTCLDGDGLRRTDRLAELA